MIKAKVLTVLAACSLWASAAHAETPVRFLNSTHGAMPVAKADVLRELQAQMDLSQYREVRVQTIYANGHADHLLVYLHSKTTHRVDFATLPLLNQGTGFAPLRANYALTAVDHASQPGTHGETYACPDEDTQFIVFAPNDDDLEQEVSKDVATAAKAAGLKTVELYIQDATRQAWLSYMSCPKLLGNFYDGDANTEVIVTNDGEIQADEISTILEGAFRRKVTNIWLACEAFNDPMLSSVIEKADTRKYAAGINDLEVGPSDKAAACAMKDAIAGKPMAAAFKACYDSLDTPDDKWGFDGHGTDNFWD